MLPVYQDRLPSMQELISTLALTKDLPAPVLPPILTVDTTVLHASSFNENHKNAIHYLVGNNPTLQTLASRFSSFEKMLLDVDALQAILQVTIDLNASVIEDNYKITGASRELSQSYVNQINQLTKNLMNQLAVNNNLKSELNELQKQIAQQMTSTPSLYIGFLEKQNTLLIESVEDALKRATEAEAKLAALEKQLASSDANRS